MPRKLPIFALQSIGQVVILAIMSCVNLANNRLNFVFQFHFPVPSQAQSRPLLIGENSLLRQRFRFQNYRQLAQIHRHPTKVGSILTAGLVA